MDNSFKSGILKNIPSVNEIQPDDAGTLTFLKQSDYLELQKNLSAVFNILVLIIDKTNSLSNI